ncbi:MAG: signal peptidase I [Acidimicrobiales bacterium]|nr:signal peptidase I [Acidimicrobiales bacterium]MCB1014418.1 signal peptidase I [Acidimicrobiales bacterium]MCB9373853.1 signal peptidase I [Microthrixaceae bacterium]
MGPSPTPTVGRFVAGLVGLFVVGTVGWMVLWGAATTLLYGQRPVVVSSGSMAPALDVGDLVVVEPYHGQTVYEGSVVVFDDEAGGRSIIHRVVDVHEDGTFTTGGDANRSHDSDPLTRDRIEASGRFLLPRLGLPVVWAREGRWLLVLLATVGFGFSLWLTRFALLDAHDPWLADAASSRAGRPARQRAAAWARHVRGLGAGAVAPRRVLGLARRRVAELGAVALTVLVAHATVTAYAAFAATTGNAGNQFAAGTLAAPSGFSVAPGSCVGSASVGFRSASHAANTSGDEIVIARPAGVQEGDVMIAGISWHTHDSSGTQIDPPAGWNAIRIDTEFTHIVQGLFWKAATSAEPASYRFGNGTLDSSREVVGGIAAYTGVDPVTPVDVHGGTATPSVVFTLTAPSVAATVAGGRLVSFFGQHDPGLFSTPAGMSGRFTDTVGNGERAVHALLADQALASAGATGTRSATSAGNGSGVAQSLVLDPAGGVTSASLSWAPSPSPFADGYLLQRFIGATLDDQWLITPESASSVVDFGGLVAGTGYTYRLSTTSGTWRSPPVTLAYTPASC